jgi:Fe-S-cluster-containing dehydrogenase component
MDKSRRDFLWKFGFAVLAGSSGLPILRALASTEPGGETVARTVSKQWCMIVDIEKCLDDRIRHACIEACVRAHNIPHIPDPKEEIKWIWSEPYENAFPERVHEHTTPLLKEKPVLVMCNHCTHPPCVKVCPTQATWKRKQDGIVMMDMHRCIGCRYCMAACPYGSRSFNWRDPRPYIEGGTTSSFPTRTKGVVEKCDFCAERIRDGRMPACVEAAEATPGGKGALIFGNISDPESLVSRTLREKNSLVRKVSDGTGPNVFYLV